MLDEKKITEIKSMLDDANLGYATPGSASYSSHVCALLNERAELLAELEHRKAQVEIMNIQMKGLHDANMTLRQALEDQKMKMEGMQRPSPVLEVCEE
jgi:hypothetical protein